MRFRFASLYLLPAFAAMAIFALLLAVGCGGSGGGGSNNTAYFTTTVTPANFPTAVRVAPDGRIFYTEKNTGNVRIIENGLLLPTPFANVSVGTTNEQGLNGLALDPDFANNGYVYLFYSQTSGTQRIARFTDVNNVGTNFTIILDSIPQGSNHNGGRLEFGQDGKLYATVGENGDPANSQDMGTLAGKVLRMNPDGTIPGDNPTNGSYIYTLGHRNCFGIAVYPSTGTVYVTENGPTCDDEINRLIPGGNYGWRPSQPCGDTNPSYIQPVRRYSSIIAPTGAVFYTGTKFPGLTGDLLMTSFGEQTLRRLTINDSGNGSVTSESVLLSTPAGAIDVAQAPSGDVYIATTNAILELVAN